MLASVITSAIAGHERKSNHFTPARMSAPCPTLCYAVAGPVSESQFGHTAEAVSDSVCQALEQLEHSRQPSSSISE